jgi:hypothetical protein
MLKQSYQELNFIEEQKVNKINKIYTTYNEKMKTTNPGTTGKLQYTTININENITTITDNNTTIQA